MTDAEFFKGIRSQFPAMMVPFQGRQIVYLDSAATTLKPESVVKRISDFYLYESSNVHRGAHTMADVATTNFENARAHAARLIGADANEIVFVRNTTEAVNLAAMSWGEKHLKAGQTIVLSQMEHHANVVPWQMLAERKGLKICAVQVTSKGEFDLEDFRRILKNENVGLVSVTGCSNTLGTFTPLAEIRRESAGIPLFVDAAQLISQRKIDVRAEDLDFLAFSGHKLFGPTGIGVLYAKKSILDSMPPWQGGGSMISKVSFDGTTFNEAPFRFEAGTPHIAGAIGLDSAISFFESIPADRLRRWEDGLLRRATEGLRSINGITIFGDVEHKAPILSFNLKGAHHSDVGQILDQQNVAVRAGHHCTQPLMSCYGVPGTVRASFSVYNNENDVDAFLKGVVKAKELLT